MFFFKYKEIKHSKYFLELYLKNLSFKVITILLITIRRGKKRRLRGLTEGLFISQKSYSCIRNVFIFGTRCARNQGLPYSLPNGALQRRKINGIPFPYIQNSSRAYSCCYSRIPTKKNSSIASFGIIGTWFFMESTTKIKFYKKLAVPCALSYPVWFLVKIAWAIMEKYVK